MAPAEPLVRERLCGDLQQPITALAWSSDGEFLAIASAGGELLLLDFGAGCEELLRGEHDSSLDVVGFSDDGQFLMAAGQSGELLLWELGGTGVRPRAFAPMRLGAAGSTRRPGSPVACSWRWRSGGRCGSGMGPAAAGGSRPWISMARSRPWPGVPMGCSWRPVAMGSWCCGSRLGVLHPNPGAQPHRLGRTGPGVFDARPPSGLRDAGSFPAGVAGGLPR